jgi:iron complex outermembrane receptor protein
VPAITPALKPASPTKSEAVEAGVKWQARDYPISIDASVFAIQQTNVTTDAPGNPGFELQTGEQESIGADFELRAEPAPWLSLTTRYTFIDAQILNDAVVRNGTTPLNVAKHQLGALGLINGSILKPDDLSIGLSLNYLSDRQGSLEPEELSLKLPGYFRGDVFIMWRFSARLGFELGIENFSDEEYIQGSQSDGLHLTPGDPITVRGQIKLSF